ncbi:hypothetical protein Pd630_LPD02040 [Rhodococcus opacus PD630]|nr:hypothetical protein Pd630_LPD02040 [Rhodococcus opacus PD630]
MAAGGEIRRRDRRGPGTVRRRGHPPRIFRRPLLRRQPRAVKARRNPNRYHVKYGASSM